MIRSILAVLAGLAVLTAASFAVDAAMDPLLLWAFPKALSGPQMLASNLWVERITFAYSLLCIAAGGYVAARVARRLRVAHAAITGTTQAGLTLMAMLSSFGNHGSRSHWIIAAVLSIPAALLGGTLAKGRKPYDGLGANPASASVC